ncbi:type II toxin-antitoxin system VapC family toxin [Halalkalicoccus jeotgali]|uniref:PilT protein domain protein n=1 Tax=Halalkalicoccus jeotgali (strain DSM 18796 / CECT 7217 / JCM 14584 / KCTC 4019 / B3) TaxID=795797 RepID=D8JAZ8_HALJB|nr:type II toxin-antitoxin system VapC family toxin [Halalkalicoccus jeotgali]ADJ16451.1 PilT protein domain protein [Halalkalicoccus jeotgali B3]ELY41454.1 PilT protein domain-containing protein [Halalkalicoccus jeotgali B3]
MTVDVVDASVVAKWFLPERDSNEARALRDAYVDGAIDLCAPSAMPFEVANALRHSSMLDDTHIEQSMDAVAAYGLDLFAFADIPGIISLSIKEELPVYDASYVALADHIDGVCWTADQKLIDSLSSSAQTATKHARDFENP